MEMGGIEPPSDVVLSGLLRAQFASDFLGPSHPANRWLIRAQSSKVPFTPMTEANSSGYLNDARIRGDSNPGLTDCLTA